MKNNVEKYLFYCFIFFLPLENILDIFFDIDTFFKPYRLLSLILIFSFFLKFDSNNKSLLLKKESFLILVVIFIGLIVSIVHLLLGDINTKSFFTEIFQVFQVVGVFVVLQKYFKKYLNTTFVIVLYSSILLNSFFINLTLISDGQAVRMNGFLENSNVCGFFLNLGVILSFYLLKKAGELTKGLILLFVISIVYSILQTGSRSNLIVLSVILLVAHFIYLKPSFFLFLLISIFLASSFLFINSDFMSDESNSITLKRIKHKAENEEYEDIRIRLLKAGIDLGKMTLFTGIGVGQMVHKSPEVYRKYDYENWLSGRKTGLTIHNLYLTILLEYSFLALLIFIIFLFSIFKQILYEMSIKASNSQFKLLLFLLSLLIFFFHTSTTLMLPWILLSIASTKI